MVCKTSRTFSLNQRVNLSSYGSSGIVHPLDSPSDVVAGVVEAVGQRASMTSFIHLPEVIKETNLFGLVVDPNSLNSLALGIHEGAVSVLLVIDPAAVVFSAIGPKNVKNWNFSIFLIFSNFLELSAETGPIDPSSHSLYGSSMV